MSRRRIAPSRVSAAAALTAVFAGLLAGCASEPLNMSLGTVDEDVEVTVLGDGFVDAAGRRLARETFVLELRQRTRGLSEDQRTRIRVSIRVRRDSGEQANTDSAWLLDQIYLMGLGQGRLYLGA